MPCCRARAPTYGRRSSGVAQPGGLERVDDAESRDAHEPAFVLTHEDVARVQRAVSTPRIAAGVDGRRERAENRQRLVNRHGHRTAQHDVERLARSGTPSRRYGVVPSRPTSRSGTISGCTGGVAARRRSASASRATCSGRSSSVKTLIATRRSRRRIERTKHRSENATAGLVKHAIRAEGSRRAEVAGLVEVQRGASLWSTHPPEDPTILARRFASFCREQRLGRTRKRTVARRRRNARVSGVVDFFGWSSARRRRFRTASSACDRFSPLSVGATDRRGLRGTVHARVASLFAGNPAEPGAWRETIARVQAAPRDRALVAGVLADQLERRGAPREARAGGRDPRRPVERGHRDRPAGRGVWRAALHRPEGRHGHPARASRSVRAQRAGRARLLGGRRGSRLGRDSDRPRRSTRTSMSPRRRCRRRRARARIRSGRSCSTRVSSRRWRRSPPRCRPPSSPGGRGRPFDGITDPARTIGGSVRRMDRRAPGPAWPGRLRRGRLRRQAGRRRPVRGRAWSAGANVGARARRRRVDGGARSSATGRARRRRRQLVLSGRVGTSAHQAVATAHTLIGDDASGRRRNSSAEAAAHPERFSPNVILRPIVQDQLFPTVCYVAGPSELAYQAQLGGVYAAFGVEPPLLHSAGERNDPRLALRTISRDARRRVRVAAGAGRIRAQPPARASTPAVDRSAHASDRTAHRRPDAALREAVTAVDPTLVGRGRHHGRDADGDAPSTCRTRSFKPARRRTTRCAASSCARARSDLSRWSSAGACPQRHVLRQPLRPRRSCDRLLAGAAGLGRAGTTW